MLRLIAVTGLVLCAVVAQAQTPAPKIKVTKIVGGGDTAFQEKAPRGGLLIGFEITLGKFVNHDVIRSLRAIYRTAQGEEIKGEQYGSPQGKLYIAKARAGYAVAGAKTRAGLLVNGFSLIYMRVNGDTLDRTDAYATVWIGGDTGGSPATLAGDGTPVVGFAGKTTANNKDCSGMGLILK